MARGTGDSQVGAAGVAPPRTKRFARWRFEAPHVDMPPEFLTLYANGLAPNVMPWANKATCAKTGTPDRWFPQAGKGGAALERTRAICRACPVAPECFAYVMAMTDAGHRVAGVWAGTTEYERRPSTRRQHRQQKRGTAA